MVIDAGHQAKGDPSLEPIGPGSRTKKPKVASGTSGVATHVDESVINLRVALKLRSVLEARGIKVVMVRTKQKVNIANSERAKIANRANAALMVRLHCDSAGSSVSGILTETPAKSWYPAHPIVDSSAKAAGYIQQAMLAETGAKDRLVNALRAEIGARVSDPRVVGWSFENEYDGIVPPDEIATILSMTVPRPAAKVALIDQACNVIYGGNLAAMAAAWAPSTTR